MGISEWLFKRRLQSRWHVSRVLLGLIIDIWVAIYMIVPALILIVSIYRDWLQTLPVWYLPAFQSLWVILIAVFASQGMPRTYLNRADLVLIYPNRRQFKKLLTYGRILSTLLKSIPQLLVLLFAFPFYYHVQGVNLTVWIWVSLWILVIETAIMNINWHLSQRLGKWIFRFVRVVAFVLFMLGWYGFVEPYILGYATILPLLFTMLLSIILALIFSSLFRVYNWDAVVAEEEQIDIERMRLFLGNAAQVVQQGSNGQAHIGKGRMGIPFRKSSVFTYYLVKYFIRKKQLWSQFGNFYALAVLILVQNVPVWVKLVFMVSILIILGVLLQLFWKEHSQDLFLRMLPLQWGDIQQGVKIGYYLVLGPFCMLFLITALLGIMWWNAVVVVIGLLLLASLISGYLALRTTVLFNYQDE